MNVPFIDLGRTASRVRAAVLPEWERCLDNCMFVGGEPVKNLEKRLETGLRVTSCVSCANGTDAILIALQALGIGPGMKVAVPNMTFWATYEAVVQLGAQPVLIDTDSDMQMDFEEFRLAHEKLGLSGAVLVHLFGWASARVHEIRAYCKENGIRLVEDGAQALGVQIPASNGIGLEGIFSGAHIGTLSFYPAKVLGGCMDGGAIVTNDPALADTCRTLCNHGRSAHYSYSHVGWNSRMGALQGAFLLAVNEHLGEMLETRVKALNRYQERLSGLQGVRLLTPPEGQAGNGYLTVLKLDSGDTQELAKTLGGQGIGTARTYPETLDMQAPAKSALRVSDLSRSRSFTERVINLPLFAWIEDQEVDYCCSKFIESL